MPWCSYAYEVIKRRRHFMGLKAAMIDAMRNTPHAVMKDLCRTDTVTDANYVIVMGKVGGSCDS